MPLCGGLSLSGWAQSTSRWETVTKGRALALPLGTDGQEQPSAGQGVGRSRPARAQDAEAGSEGSVVAPQCDLTVS